MRRGTIERLSFFISYRGLNVLDTDLRLMNVERQKGEILRTILLQIRWFRWLRNSYLHQTEYPIARPNVLVSALLANFLFSPDFRFRLHVWYTRVDTSYLSLRVWAPQTSAFHLRCAMSMESRREPVQSTLYGVKEPRGC